MTDEVASAVLSGSTKTVETALELIRMLAPAAKNLLAGTASLGKKGVQKVISKATNNGAVSNARLIAEAEKAHCTILIVRALNPFFCHKFNIEKHQNYQYLEDSNKKFAYLIDDLHTEKAPDTAESHTEKVSLAKPEYDEKALADLDIPDDDEFMEVENMETETPKTTLDEEFSDDTSSSERLLYDDEPDFSDEELPNPDEMMSFDMSEMKEFGEDDFEMFSDSF